MKRRSVLAGGSVALLAGLGGCLRPDKPDQFDGGWVGVSDQRGHLLRDRDANTPGGGKSAVARRVSVLIVGAGVAGLACARALRRRGIDDFALLDLEDSAGGNSRGHSIAGMACPLGAHYLPVPGAKNGDLIELLTEFGLCREEAGQRIWDERHLCHSPQERLFVPDASSAAKGHWFEGLLLPPELLPKAEQQQALSDYRRFAELVDRYLRSGGFTIPTWQAGWNDESAALDAISFQTWLDRQGLNSTALRNHLDYCCRDDYGASPAQVSAWAGLQYFASRHGFHVAGDDASDSEGVLTWPQGNAWLTEGLAKPLGDRLQLGRTVLRVDEGRHEVSVDAWNHAAGQLERWTARQLVIATPLFIASRLLRAPSAALQDAAGQLTYAPWLVANLHLDEALRDHPGAPPSWDNVIYGSRSLGYVDAMHQSTRPYTDATVLTAYWALGGDNPAQAHAARSDLIRSTWQGWSQRVLGELETAHADLRSKVRRIDLMRYGHAMSVPSPGTRGHPALHALARQSGRIAFAHSDLSGYSIFEEAFFHGHRAGNTLRT